MGDCSRAHVAALLCFAELSGCGSPSRPPTLTDNGGTASDAGTAGSDAAPVTLPASDEAALESFVTAHMATAQVPGAAAAILSHGQVAWTHGFGHASIADGRPVTADTLFMLASISKTFVAVAAMQLVEAKKFALDDDIDAVLPYAIRNPNFPGTPITYRMLLTHTSSLLDGDAIANLVVSKGDATTTLADWVKSYVLPGGAAYAANNWATTTPGTTYSYSNMGASLAGYLVELVSGKNLQDYSAANIFAPLAMTESSWFLAGLDVTHIAHPYEWEPTTAAYVDQGFYGFPDYPDGQLRTSAAQLARYLAMFAQGGTYQGARVLTSASVAEMKRRQIDALGGNAVGQGLIWAYATEIDGTQTLGHSGAYLGVSTDMYFDPKTGNGYVWLTNGGVYFDYQTGAKVDAMSQIDAELLGTAAKLAGPPVGQGGP